MTQRDALLPLTGLRGIAALFVVITHYAFWCSTYKWETIPKSIEWIFTGNEYGMTLFFTLSGFVITYNYADFGWDHRPGAALVRFLYLRFSRLYPALVMFLLTFLLPVTYRALVEPQYLHWLELHLLFSQSWRPWKFNGALVGNTTFHVSWSISTEAMLYIMFAAVALLAHQAIRRKSRWGKAAVIFAVSCYLVVCVSLAVSPGLFERAISLFGGSDLTAAEWNRWFFYLSPYFRITNFFFGAMAALVVLRYPDVLVKHRMRVRALATSAGLAAVALYVASYRFDLATEVFGDAANQILQLICSFLFATVMMNAADRSRANRFLSSKPLVGLGEISYSLYLFHYLLPRLGTYQATADFSWPLFAQFLVNFGVMLFFAVAFAYGMYRLLEMPAQQALRRLWIFATKAPASTSAPAPQLIRGSEYPVVADREKPSPQEVL